VEFCSPNHMKCKAHSRYYIVICSIFEYTIHFLSYKRHEFMTNVSNIKVCTDFSTTIYLITDAPWYVPNAVIKHDLQFPSVPQEVRTFSVTYHARLEGHPNDLATSLLQQSPHNHRLKRYFPANLVTRF
jgi:hypothetical protein